MAEASQSITINATPKECMKVITDYEKYPEFLKETKSVTILKRKGKITEVTFEVEVMRKVSYTLTMNEESPNKLSWALIKGDMFKKNDGSWTLEEVKKGVTKATYTVDVDLGLFIPSMITKTLVGSQLPNMLKNFKQRIEGSK